MQTREMRKALEDYALLPRPKQEEIIEVVKGTNGVNMSFRMLNAMKAFVKEVRDAAQQERG